MRIRFLNAILVCAFVTTLGVLVNGQSGPNPGNFSVTKKPPTSASSNTGGNPALSLAGKVTIVVIKSATKTAWATTKFAAKDVAKPILVGVAKPLLLKATPKITVFALKLTGKSLKKGIPIATKLGMTYLKAKLPL